jgi:hypothetical protein
VKVCVEYENGDRILPLQTKPLRVSGPSSQPNAKG